MVRLHQLDLFVQPLYLRVLAGDHPLQPLLLRLGVGRVLLLFLRRPEQRHRGQLHLGAKVRVLLPFLVDHPRYPELQLADAGLEL